MLHLHYPLQLYVCKFEDNLPGIERGGGGGGGEGLMGFSLNLFCNLRMPSSGYIRHCLCN